jgi:hypothetical protein
MSIEIEKFLIKDVSFKYAESQEINSASALRPIIVDVKSLQIICKLCHHEWLSRDFGEGRFRSAVGNVHIQCPSCNANESIEINRLK